MRKLYKLMFIAIFVGMFGFHMVYQLSASMHKEEWSNRLENWEFRWGTSPVDVDGRPSWTLESDNIGWSPAKQLMNPPDRAKNEELWLRTRIPEGDWRDPSVTLRVEQHYELYTQQGRFYSYGSMESGERERFPGVSMRIVPLPAEAIGEYIYLRVYSSSSTIGITDDVWLGTRSDFILNSFRLELIEIIFGFFYIIIGIMFLYAFTTLHDQPLFIAFSIFTLFFGIFSISETATSHYLFDNTSFWSYITILSLNLGIVGLILFIEKMLDSGPMKLIRRLWQFHLLYGIGSSILMAAQLVAVYHVSTVYQILIMISALLILVKIFLDAKRGWRAARIVVFGCLVMCITGIEGLIGGSTNYTGVFPSLTTICLAGFIIIVFIQLLNHLMELVVMARNSARLSMISQLAAGIAHEIRNPISVISGFIQLLQKDPSQEKYLQLISSEIERINRIVGDFLLFSKPPKENMKSWLVTDILKDTLELFMTQINEKQLELDFQADSQLPHIQCEANQLKQVFFNIIKNAIESMTDGGKLSIAVTKEKMGQICIRIADQGTGIPPDVLRRLGQPFNSTKEQGTGLGLMICVKYVEHHGGTLKFSSKVNEGTTVDILLPIRQN